MTSDINFWTNVLKLRFGKKPAWVISTFLLKMRKNKVRKNA